MVSVSFSPPLVWFPLSTDSVIYGYQSQLFPINFQLLSGIILALYDSSLIMCRLNLDTVKQLQKSRKASHLIEAYAYMQPHWMS